MLIFSQIANRKNGIIVGFRLFFGHFEQIENLKSELCNVIPICLGYIDVSNVLFFGSKPACLEGISGTYVNRQRDVGHQR